MTQPLHDICNLGLHLRSLNDDIVPAVVSLFRAVTNLNTLHMKCSIFAGGGQCDVSESLCCLFSVKLFFSFG